MDERSTRVSDLLHEAAETHHRVFRITDGADDDWASWYAQWLVGPIVAAIVLCAWSHPGRCGSDGAFAMLAGAAPIPASSGQTVRVRRNRSGDRQLNQALHLVVLTRCAMTRRPALMPSDAAPKARPTAKSDAAWSATSPASSTDSSRPIPALTRHRSVQENDPACPRQSH
jgi:hypothetical protein